LALSYGGSYGAQPSPAPVLVAFAGPAPQRRLTVFFRLILVIPALIVFLFFSIAAFFVIVIAWFGALVLGRLPAFAAEFLPGYVRWSTRVTAYTVLLTDRYPPFSLENDDAFPVWLTAQPGRLNRGAVFFRIIIVLPAFIVSSILQQGAFSIVAFVTWLIVLVNGTMPASLFQAYSAVIRYQARVSGYLVMITSEYPWGLFGDTETVFFGGAPAAYGVSGGSAPYGAYGAPPGPGAYGAGGYGAGGYGAPPPPTGAFGAPPPPGTVGGYVTPPPPDPAATFAPAPQTPPAPAPPFLPGVAFTFGGPSYLWGYTDDRTYCGIWSAHDLSAPPQMWPITDQGDGWTRFRELEPTAVALAEPTPPPAVASWSPPATSSYGAPPPGITASPSAAASSPADDPRWRIVLSSAARRLLVVFLVLGLITSVVNRSSFFGWHPFQGFVANVQVRLDYQVLKNSLSTYDASTAACESTGASLSCLTAADRTMAQGFATFVHELGSISMPAGAAAAAHILLVDGGLAEGIFGDLGASTNTAAYQAILQRSNVDQLLTKMDQDEQALTQQLG
jgi:hypothetical protein